MFSTSNKRGPANAPQPSPSPPDRSVAARAAETRPTLERSPTTVAPAFLHGMLQSPAGTLDPAARASAEEHFGYDLSNVLIHTDSAAHAAAAAMRVPAFAWGEHIGFAAGADQSGAAAEHMLAHELAHVIQQQQGDTSSLANHNSPAERRRLEADAETSARAALGDSDVARPHSASMSAPSPLLQGFDPEYHEQATIGGLTGTFTPAEIGKIYEANWRRDFSQSAPLIADIVLAWKELRDKAAATGQADPGLQWEILKLVTQLPGELPKILAGEETYGGYRYWEHMDDPGEHESGKASAGEAEQRWGSGSSDIPGYIRDSRASIKDKLANAIMAYRTTAGIAKPDSGRTRADAWSRGSPPADYDMWNPYQDRTKPPLGYGSPQAVSDPAHSSSVVAQEVQTIAAGRPGHVETQAGALPDFARDPSVADNLGRASHLVEDFFAHSNFVELATALQAGGRPMPAASLRTGTFDTPDKLHSLGGKLRDAAAEIDANRKLIPLVAGKVVDTLRAAAATAESGSRALHPAPGSHTYLAKDTPSAPGDFAMAHRLAIAADQMVFFWVHRVMQEMPPDKAERDTYILFDLIDAIVTVPSDHHPLRSIFSGGAAP